MIRFQNGVPQAMWLSQHQSGQAFTYNAMQKMGFRVSRYHSLAYGQTLTKQQPVAYSAQNSHALYGLVG